MREANLVLPFPMAAHLSRTPRERRDARSESRPAVPDDCSFVAYPAGAQRCAKRISSYRERGQSVAHGLERRDARSESRPAVPDGCSFVAYPAGAQRCAKRISFHRYRAAHLLRPRGSAEMREANLVQPFPMAAYLSRTPRERRDARSESRPLTQLKTHEHN